MKQVTQTLEEILEALSPLQVEWRDDVANRVIKRLDHIPTKKLYEAADIKDILDWDFNDGLLICRLFLGMSKDDFVGQLKGTLKDLGIGKTGYRDDPAAFIDGLLALGVLDAMAASIVRKPKWSDVLVERLRSGRGRAISGQKRGRGVEDFAEQIVESVFGARFDKRCSFMGKGGKRAKCDFAIPSRTNPRVLIEAKGYAATGSKMTDVLGDVEKIIGVKRSDTSFFFFTDGVTWNQRRSDLRKLIAYQNNGDITRIYTSAMAAQFKADLQQLKAEAGL
jgi:hypothetical protein